MQGWQQLELLLERLILPQTYPKTSVLTSSKALCYMVNKQRVSFLQQKKHESLLRGL